jgi:DNA modification methylase
VSIILDRDGVTIHNGDCIEVLRTIPDESVQCCVTSPPYWGLRDYGHNAQIGLEATPEAYVGRMVEVFREVRRVLRDDGTLWLNLGDSYANPGGGKMAWSTPTEQAKKRVECADVPSRDVSSLKPKDLCGIPWRVAFALQADGWYLRQDIIWHKPNPMPESVTDRCTKAHEYVFLMAKSQRYYYDAEAIDEPLAGVPHAPGNKATKEDGHLRNDFGTEAVNRLWGESGRRNRRSVWTVCTKPYSGAHFAVMPPDLVKPCILAGCPEGGVVLDPFMGSGTVAAVAQDAGRLAIGIELNPEYCKLIAKRFKQRRII